MAEVICMYCVQDMHFLCGPDCKCDEAPVEEVSADDEDTEIFGVPKSRGAKIKVSEFKDQLSTGRKRAAMLYPLIDGMICEWAWQKNCGGGIYPILGCTGRPAKHIHHGPDKSVINNSPDNVSRVCHFCHNLWHAKNDPYFDQPRPENGKVWLPHKDDMPVHALSEREAADPLDIVEHEMALKRKIDMEHIKFQGISLSENADRIGS